jgi:hypothetical protein
MKQLLVAAVSAALLTVSASAQTRPVDGGQTAVTLSPEFLSALSTLGVTATPVIPGQILTGVASFAVTGGTIDLATAQGEITHSGGLELRAGNTVVRLLNFTIDLGAMNRLTGAVVANGSLVGRVHLFDLTLPSGITLPLTPQNELLVVPNTQVRLSAAAATALNSLFNVTAFTEGFEIGTARVSTFLNRRTF